MGDGVGFRDGSTCAKTGGIVSGFYVSVFLGVCGGVRGEYSVTLGIGWDGVS